MNHKAVRGAMMVEAAIIVTLLLGISLGFAQLYWLVTTKLKYVAVATEMMLGPQERSLSYNSATAAFDVLDATTTPTLDQFYDTLGNFFQARAADDTALLLQLLYLNVDGATGAVTGYTAASAARTYTTKDVVGCTSPDDTTRFEKHVDAAITRMAKYEYPDSWKVQTSPKSGIKLYSVRVAGTTYEAYIDKLPVVFMRMCRRSAPPIVPTTSSSDFILMPQRLVN